MDHPKWCPPNSRRNPLLRRCRHPNAGDLQLSCSLSPSKQWSTNNFVPFDGLLPGHDQFKELLRTNIGQLVMPTNWSPNNWSPTIVNYWSLLVTVITVQTIGHQTIGHHSWFLQTIGHQQRHYSSPVQQCWSSTVITVSWKTSPGRPTAGCGQGRTGVTNALSTIAVGESIVLGE